MATGGMSMGHSKDLTNGTKREIERNNGGDFEILMKLGFAPLSFEYIKFVFIPFLFQVLRN